MTARHLLAFGSVTVAALAAAPALANPDMNYEERVYEYAQPAPPQATDVIFRQDPVVQPLPAPRPAYAAPAPGADYEYEYDYEYETEAAPGPAHHPAAHHQAPYHPHAMHGAAHPAQPTSWSGPPLPPEFDRKAWIDECRDRIDGKDSSKKGGIIGALLGAIAGGVVGNRVWDSERLAGSLIGAGTGGLVGLAIGSAIGGSGKRSDREICEAYLDRYFAGYGYGNHGYGYPGYGYGYGYGYTMMPVMIAVPQRAVVREYVTEEWVDVPVKHKPAKKVRYIKQAPSKTVPVQTKTIKYRK